jgi:hypothetical protein
MKPAEAALADASDLGEFRWTSAPRSHPDLSPEINENTCLDQPGPALLAIADHMGAHAPDKFANRLAITNYISENLTLQTQNINVQNPAPSATIKITTVHNASTRNLAPASPRP